MLWFWNFTLVTRLSFILYSFVYILNWPCSLLCAPGTTQDLGAVKTEGRPIKAWRQANPGLNSDSTTHYLCDFGPGLLTCERRPTLLHSHKVGRITWDTISRGFSTVASTWKGPSANSIIAVPFEVLCSLHLLFSLHILTFTGFLLWAPQPGKVPQPARMVLTGCLPPHFP